MMGYLKKFSDLLKKHTCLLLFLIVIIFLILICSLIFLEIKLIKNSTGGSVSDEQTQAAMHVSQSTTSIPATTITPGVWDNFSV